MRIAFDLDDTLIPVGGRFPTDAPSRWPWRWFALERLRTGAAALLQELIADGHEVWVYTTSLRPPWMVHALFKAYGVRLGGVVNQATHEAWCRQQERGRHFPSKFPPAFHIDILIDDSAGVVVEGETHGFAVVHLAPSEPSWVDYLRTRLAESARPSVDHARPR